MAHPYYPTGNPRFNHVAMSLAADLLDERTGPTSVGSGARCSASTRSR